jgi:hypothetical protein
VAALRRATRDIPVVFVVVTDPVGAGFVESLAAAHALGVEVRVLDSREPDDLEKAFEAIVKERAEALMVLADPMFISHRRRNVGPCTQAA